MKPYHHIWGPLLYNVGKLLSALSSICLHGQGATTKGNSLAHMEMSWVCLRAWRMNIRVREIYDELNILHAIRSDYDPILKVIGTTFDRKKSKMCWILMIEDRKRMINFEFQGIWNFFEDKLNRLRLVVTSDK